MIRRDVGGGATTRQGHNSANLKALDLERRDFLVLLFCFDRGSGGCGLQLVRLCVQRRGTVTAQL
jgi:hypothetical protein